MSEGVTEMFRKTLNGHKKTALGGIGGAGIATVLSLALPFIHTLNQSIVKNAEQIDALKTKVAVLEVKVQDLQQQVSKESK